MVRSQNSDVVEAKLNPHNLAPKPAFLKTILYSISEEMSYKSEPLNSLLLAGGEYEKAFWKSWNLCWT